MAYNVTEKYFEIISAMTEMLHASVFVNDI